MTGNSLIYRLKDGILILVFVGLVWLPLLGWVFGWGISQDLGEKRSMMEESVLLYGDPVNVSYSPELKFARGTVDLAREPMLYTLAISASDLKGGEAESAFIVVAPVYYALARSIIAIGLLLYMVVEIGGRIIGEDKKPTVEFEF